MNDEDYQKSWLPPATAHISTSTAPPTFRLPRALLDPRVSPHPAGRRPQPFLGLRTQRFIILAAREEHLDRIEVLLLDQGRIGDAGQADDDPSQRRGKVPEPLTNRTDRLRTERRLEHLGDVLIHHEVSDDVPHAFFIAEPVANSVIPLRVVGRSKLLDKPAHDSKFRAFQGGAKAARRVEVQG